MKVALAVCVALAAAVAVLANPNAKGQNFAVLIAGSNTYMNYRHQADVCHAYQIMHKNGIPDLNIVVMMYDDIANNSENPEKGTIINKPGGSDVYKGVPKDYTGDDVNAKNFLAVLTGENVPKGKKSINPGPNDNVFVFFSDHGGPGLIAMPTGDYLYAKDLIAALKDMHSKKRFNQLVFYLEACESGSMFDGLLPNDINIFATTASNPDESSYACYWDATLQAYLGDLYSVNWMENSDKVDLTKETLQSQFTLVKQETNLSHVMEYGQQSISSQPLSHFQAFGQFFGASSAGGRAGLYYKPLHPEHNRIDPVADAVDARDIVMETLKRRVESARTVEAREAAVAALDVELMKRQRADRIMTTMASQLIPEAHAPSLLAARHPVVHDCIKDMVTAFEAQCGRFDDYSLKHAHVLNTFCHYGMSVEQVREAAAIAC